MSTPGSEVPVPAPSSDPQVAGAVVARPVTSSCVLGYVTQQTPFANRLYVALPVCFAPFVNEQDGTRVCRLCFATGGSLVGESLRRVYQNAASGRWQQLALPMDSTSARVPYAPADLGCGDTHVSVGPHHAAVCVRSLMYASGWSVRELSELTTLDDDRRAAALHRFRRALDVRAGHLANYRTFAVPTKAMVDEDLRAQACEVLPSFLSRSVQLYARVRLSPDDDRVFLARVDNTLDAVWVAQERSASDCAVAKVLEESSASSGSESESGAESDSAPAAAPSVASMEASSVLSSSAAMPRAAAPAASVSSVAFMEAAWAATASSVLSSSAAMPRAVSVGPPTLVALAAAEKQYMTTEMAFELFPVVARAMRRREDLERALVDALPESARQAVRRRPETLVQVVRRLSNEPDRPVLASTAAANAAPEAYEARSSSSSSSVSELLASVPPLEASVQEVLERCSQAQSEMVARVQAAVSVRAPVVPLRVVEVVPRAEGVSGECPRRERVTFEGMSVPDRVNERFEVLQDAVYAVCRSSRASDATAALLAAEVALRAHYTLEEFAFARRGCACESCCRGAAAAHTRRIAQLLQNKLDVTSMLSCGLIDWCVARFWA